MYRTKDGGVSVMLFTTIERAQRFIESKGQSENWYVGQMTQTEAADWLREAMTRNGASHVTRDPDPDQAEYSMAPIFTILVELEG